MRRVSALAGIMGAVLATAAAPAGAQQGTAPLTVTGGITVTWRGDEARGCAAAGLCGTEGRAVLSVAAEGTLFRPGPGTQGLFGFVFGSGPGAVVRVVRQTGEQPPPICTDAPGRGGVPGDFSVRLTSRGSGPVRVGFDATTALSAGRCAGPLPADLVGALPSTDVPLSQLRPGRTRVDLAGRRTFTAGPFSGEVASTVMLRVGAVRPQRVSVRRSAPRRATRRIVRRVRTLRLDYVVARERGALRSSFAGLPAGDCEPLDACGLTGFTTLAPSLSGVALRLRGRGRAVTGRDSATRALRDIRARRLSLRTSLGTPVTGRLAGETRRAGVAGVCTDAAGRGGLRLQLRRSGDALRARLRAVESFPAASTLRTRCPGPGLAQDAVIAEGRLPLRSLGSRRLTLRLRATGLDRAPGFASPRRDGTVVLVLRRTAASATSVLATRRVR